MKYIFTFLFLILSACATPRNVHKAPCDGIANREKEFVCGVKSVVKECNAVNGTDEFVCQPL